MPAKTRKPPWKKKNPRKKAGNSSRKLSSKQKKAAKKRAKRAGRRYPNLVDSADVLDALIVRSQSFGSGNSASPHSERRLSR